MESEKLGIDDLIYKAEKQRQRHREQTHGYQEQGAAVGGGMNWESGIDIYTLLILCIK